MSLVFEIDWTTRVIFYIDEMLSIYEIAICFFFSIKFQNSPRNIQVIENSYTSVNALQAGAQIFTMPFLENIWHLLLSYGLLRKSAIWFYVWASSSCISLFFYFIFYFYLFMNEVTIYLNLFFVFMICWGGSNWSTMLQSQCNIIALLSANPSPFRKILSFLWAVSQYLVLNLDCATGYFLLFEEKRLPPPSEQ